MDQKKYICYYGKSDIPKELIISDNKLQILDSGNLIKETLFSNIASVDYSANYIRINTTPESCVIRGVRNSENMLNVMSGRSLSDSAALKEVVELLKSKSIETKFRLLILDRNVAIFLAITASIVVAIILIGLVSAWLASKDTKISNEDQPILSTQLTIEQIKDKFDCNRVTADHRATDIYCTNPSLYNQHLEFSEDQIKEFFECNRLTRERRQTDVYCQNPEQFKTDIKNGTLIQG